MVMTKTQECDVDRVKKLLESYVPEAKLESKWSIPEVDGANIHINIWLAFMLHKFYPGHLCMWSR